jgi:hypothetical protein
LARQPASCPGYHVEMGGWRKLWNLDKAINEAFSEEEKAEARALVSKVIIEIDGKQRRVKDVESVPLFIEGYAQGLLKQKKSLQVPYVIRLFNLFDEDENYIFIQNIRSKRK